MKTKVLVIDDSAYTRQIIRKIIEQDSSLEVVGVAEVATVVAAHDLELAVDGLDGVGGGEAAA